MPKRLASLESSLLTLLVLQLLHCARAIPENLNTPCHVQCHMDGKSGQCRTSFCGGPIEAVGCCKLGLIQPPCDGTLGCKNVQCCAAMHASPSPPPMPPPPPPPPNYGAEEQAMVTAAQCSFGSLSYELGKTSELNGFASAQAIVGVMPWSDQLEVTVLLQPHGQYIDVMEVEGAELLRRDQVGALLQLTFRLTDEPSRECVKAACFTVDTVGRLPSRAESISCVMPAELTDPPPSPPPRYVSKAERWGAGTLEAAPPTPPSPAPPLLSTDGVGAAHASSHVSFASHTRVAPPPSALTSTRASRPSASSAVLQTHASFSIAQSTAGAPPPPGTHTGGGWSMLVVAFLIAAVAAASLIMPPHGGDDHSEVSSRARARLEHARALAIDARERVRWAWESRSGYASARLPTSDEGEPLGFIGRGTGAGGDEDEEGEVIGNDEHEVNDGPTGRGSSDALPTISRNSGVAATADDADEALAMGVQQSLNEAGGKGEGQGRDSPEPLQPSAAVVQPALVRAQNQVPRADQIDPLEEEDGEEGEMC